MKWTKIPGNELDTIIAHDRQKRVRIAYSKSIVTLFFIVEFDWKQPSNKSASWSSRKCVYIAGTRMNFL